MPINQPSEQPLHVNTWFSSSVPPDQLRAEINNLYALVRQLLDKIAELEGDSE